MARSPNGHSTEESAFEEPILEIERRLDELSGYPATRQSQEETARLRARLAVLRTEIYSHLTPWQKTLVARHPRRPYTLDYVPFLFEDFVELHGDRRFGDDAAIVTGWAVYHGAPVAIVGHQKGHNTKENIHRNFGQPRPEGYRKALRIMKLAEKFGRPILCFVDTPGAFPGVDAESRGQAEAIAVNLREMSKLAVPVLVTITGEGGSGGALAIAVGNVVNMLEHSIYSVISPEGCAAILWKDQQRFKMEAAKNLHYTAQDLKSLDVIDDIIPEVPGGAHIDHQGSARILDEFISRHLAALRRLKPGEIVEHRHEKFRRMGAYLAPLD
ncbi:MAG: acetyl-CoA carboxylase carboxyltransferase subunit alpha [Acidobacteria bacterium]|nr:acetyl-CoA carboxylase carboxyltransferase subunit alpha [Acidobacteriota bacterium]